MRRKAHAELEDVVAAAVDRVEDRQAREKGKQKEKRRGLTSDESQAEMERMAVQARVYEAPPPGRSSQ